MAVSLIVVLADVITLLNAGTPGSSGTTVLDPRWNTAIVTDAILTADAVVCAATFRNVQNARASLYYATQTGLANGGTIAGSAGPIVAVRFTVTGGSAPGSRPGIPWDLAEITQENNDPLSLSYDPHYVILGRKIFHNGSRIAAASGGGSVSVDIDFPSFTQSSACQAADEYRWVVTVGGMSALVPVEGENAGPTGTWVAQFQEGLKWVTSGEGISPAELEQNAKAKAAGA